MKTNISMATEAMIKEKLVELESVLEEAIRQDEIKKGLYGATIGDIFVGYDGSVVFHISSPAINKALHGERIKELERDIETYREKLTIAEEALKNLTNNK